MIKICDKEIKIKGRLVRVARLDADKYKFIDDPESLIAGLRGSGVCIDLFTFMQRLEEEPVRHPYPMEWDNLAVLEVTTFQHWWTKQISSYPRNRARQAEKRGATVREVPFDESLVKGIWEIYNECPIRQGKRFQHYGKDQNTVRSMSATYLDSSIFIGVYVGAQLIGFAKLVTDDTGTQANLMHVLSMVSHKDKAPTNALIAHAVKVCADRGIRYLIYQNYSYGNKAHDGLSRFKEANGFKRVEVPRYYVALTTLGRAALLLGLHKPPSTHIPEPILSKLREYRSSWYYRRFQSAADAL